MNLDQASDYLQINRATLDRWIRQGLLANAGLRGNSFDRVSLASWARRHGIAVKESPAPQALAAENLLVDAVRRGAISNAVQATDARQAIEAVLGALEFPAQTHSALLKETLERERLAATGLGHGIAIPHPRRPPGDLVDQAQVSIGFVAEPIDWDALDGRPVHTVFLVLSPSTAIHLQLLARIAFALRSPGLEEFLTSQPTASELLERLTTISKPEGHPAP